MKNYHQLFTFARNALENAYAPYSRFRVGAAVEADDGRIYIGCNVENVSYPCGTCAEAGAVTAMVLRRRQNDPTDIDHFRRLVAGHALRRLLAENRRVCRPRHRNSLPTVPGVRQTFKMAELLPNAFKEF